MSKEHLAAVCGLYCGACGLYRTRRNGSPAQQQELAKTLSERWGVPPEEVDCEGCLSGGKLSPYCRNCQILRCPATKKVPNGAQIVLIFPVTSSRTSTMTGYATMPKYWLILNTSARLASEPGSKSRSKDGNVRNAAHRRHGTRTFATDAGRSNPTACRRCRVIKSDAAPLSGKERSYRHYVSIKHLLFDTRLR
ncbi:MAG: DUF3795 domain-containing protein [Dehalococcoidales bacterium]|nr:DUF3795 domain-containing protein [Dehalococcoidales bacterium]